MSLATTISADLRAKANWLAYCPCCSFVNIPDQPDILHGPNHREFRGLHKLETCCLLSAGCPPMDSRSEVAAWWRKRRLEPLKDIATDRRRLNTLAKLKAKDLEPIT